MKPDKEKYFSLEKYLGLPTVFFTFSINSYGFSFLIDTSVRKNLIDPCFFEEWIGYTSPATSDDPNSIFYYPVLPVPHEKLKAKRIICKDGVRRVCDMIKLDFFIKDKKYSESFAIDTSMCSYFRSKKFKKIVGVLF